MLAQARLIWSSHVFVLFCGNQRPLLLPVFFRRYMGSWRGIAMSSVATHELRQWLAPGRGNG